MEPPILVEDAFYADHGALFARLVASTAWDERMTARRTASFGQPYNYAQMSYPERPIPAHLWPLLERLHVRLEIGFNNCLLNYYPTGEHTMGFHADDTTHLVAGSGVAIVSLGSVREITYRSKVAPDVQRSYALQPGSLLYMDDRVQAGWVHAIRRQAGAGPRISLTWRAIRPQGDATAAHDPNTSET